MAAERPPDVLTVPEAGRILRMGKSAAYEQARLWIDTDGERGFPAKRIGRAVRVPRVMLEEYLGGPISWPPPAIVTTIANGDSRSQQDQVVEIDLADRSASRKRRTEAAKQAKAMQPGDDDQSRLPFSA